MAFDRPDCDHELLGNLTVAGSLGDEVEHFQLALAEAFSERCLRRAIARPRMSRAEGSRPGERIQDALNVAPVFPALGGLAEQLGQGRSLIISGSSMS